MGISSIKSLVLILLVASLCATSNSAKGEETRCHSPELIHQKNYDDLVCAADEMMERRNYDQAITLFANAMDIPLYEVPNFRLYPRLALANHLAGHNDKAKEYLEKSELSLMVFTRVLSCRELNSNDAPILVKTVWGKDYKIDSPYESEIAKRMCGAAFDRIYHPESLTEISGESVLVKNYIEIKDRIAGK